MSNQTILMKPFANPQFLNYNQNKDSHSPQEEIPLDSMPQCSYQVVTGTKRIPFKSMTHIASNIGASWCPLFPGDSVIKNRLPMQETQKRRSFDPWVGKILWRRKWQPTPVFLPEKSHGQRSLVGYGPWCCSRT